MELEALAFWLQPAAALGVAAASLAALGVCWRYRGSRSGSLKWYLKNWRMMQVLGVTALYFFALAGTCVFVDDLWGWLYLMLGMKVGIWWVTRLVGVHWGVRYFITPDVRS